MVTRIASWPCEEQAQRDDLPLPGGQPQQRRHDPRIDGVVADPAGRGQASQNARVG
jgi:hypothetical protein